MKVLGEGADLYEADLAPVGHLPGTLGDTPGITLTFYDV